MPVNQPEYDTAVETNWDGVDQSEFESFEQFASVHVWWNTENPETSEDVELPVAHMEDGQLKLVYEALNSAHDLAENAVGEENAEDVRNALESLREEEFPDREPLDADENSISLNYVKSITDEEVPECISDKIDEGWDQDRAIAACLNMAEEGSSEPTKNVDTMNVEEKEERVNDINENREQLKTADLKVTGKDVEVVKESQDSNGEIVVNVPIQALSEDRDGDFINEKGQESIIRQLKSGQVPLMLNHGVGSSAAMYDARDIVGQFIDGDNRNGTTIGTARMRMNKEGEELHSDAKEIVDLLEQDMPIGFSVGFIPQEVDEKENGGMEISDLDLMEVSAVGIPSNPDAVPQAMGTAAQMAKNAGLSKNEIMSTIEKAFNDTMTEKQESDGQEQNEGSKSDEKQMTSEDVEAAMEVVASKVSEHMSMAMDEAEDEVMAMIDEESEDEEEETDEMDEDEEEEEDTVESNSEPEKQDDGSDHTEDSEKSSSESADDESEKESGLSEDEKTVNKEEDEGKRLSTDESEEKQSEEKQSEVDYDPRMAV